MPKFSARASAPSESSLITSKNYHTSMVAGLILILAVLCSACVKTGPVEEETLVAFKPKLVVEEGITSDGLLLKTGLAQEVLLAAYSQVGTPYRYGGTTPQGFDCSGFTRWVYSQNGIQLPRSSKEQFQVGRAVDKEEIKPGDLLMYKRGNRGGTHIGIYVGDGKYIHSPSRGKTVMEANAFNPGGSLKFLGARRVFEDPASCVLTSEQKDQAKDNFVATNDVEVKVVLTPPEADKPKAANAGKSKNKTSKVKSGKSGKTKNKKS